MNFQDFLLWEASTRDTIDFKKAYVDIADDVIAGLVLSEIVFWNLPNKKGDSKLKVRKDGKSWIAVRRYEWWDRVRLTPRQSDRAISILKGLGIIETAIFKWYGEPTVHITLTENVFLERFASVMNTPKSNPFSPNSENQFTENVKTNSPKQVNPVTENTSETTTKEKKASPSSLFIDSLKEHFGLIVHPAWKAEREFLKWAIDEAKITPEMVAYAASAWDNDQTLNWKGKRPRNRLNIKTFQQEWLRMIEGYNAEQTDDAPFEFSLA